jgi:hypothetical protein
VDIRLKGTKNRKILDGTTTKYEYLPYNFENDLSETNTMRAITRVSISLILIIFWGGADAQITLVLGEDGDGAGNTANGYSGIAFDSSGNLYASSAGNNEDFVFKVTPGGAISTVVTGSGDGLGNAMSFAYSISVDPFDNLLVPASATDNVFRVSPEGQILKILDASGDGKGNTLETPLNAVGSLQGNYFVTGRESDNAFKITSEGVITEVIDATGDGNGKILDGAQGIVVDAQENIYVSGTWSNNVFMITPGGTITEIIDATGDGQGNTLSNPETLAIDSSGNLFVSSRLTDLVLKRNPNGTIQKVIGSDGDGQGNGLTTPRGLDVDSTGNLYVTGSGSRNAFRVTPTGQVTEIINPSAVDGTSYFPPVLDGIGVSNDGSVAVSGGLNLYRIELGSPFPEVSNGGFDSSATSGWLNPAGTANLNEVLGVPAPSAALGNEEPSATTTITVLSQCVNLEPLTAYDVTADIFIEDGQSSSGSASVFVETFASADCSDGEAKTGFSSQRLIPHQQQAVSETGVWQTLRTPVSMPPGEFSSARIDLVVSKNESGGSFIAHFDNVTLRLQHRIFTDGFESMTE